MLAFNCAVASVIDNIKLNAKPVATLTIYTPLLEKMCLQHVSSVHFLHRTIYKCKPGKIEQSAVLQLIVEGTLLGQTNHCYHFELSDGDPLCS